MDLIEFLRARLDEDDAVAKFAASGTAKASGVWTARPRSGSEHDSDFTVLQDDGWGLVSKPDFSMSDADHIARHDPARVLREVAAKRAIVTEHEWGTSSGPLSVGRTYCATCCDDRCYAQQYPHDEPHPNAPCCVTLRLVATVYADHPDYDEEWRP